MRKLTELILACHLCEVSYLLEACPYYHIVAGGRLTNGLIIPRPGQRKCGFIERMCIRNELALLAVNCKRSSKWRSIKKNKNLIKSADMQISTHLFSHGPENGRKLTENHEGEAKLHPWDGKLSHSLLSHEESWPATEKAPCFNHSATSETRLFKPKSTHQSPFPRDR
jgi:hypothetical protein